jgi:hypothetical protein
MPGDDAEAESETGLIAEADQVADWVEGVLSEDAPKTPAELRALAAEGLKLTRKSKDYRSEILFASLVQLYQFMPRLGRLKASLRVAKAIGRGPAFARVLNVQACHFEATGSLKATRQGQRQKGTSILDDEAFYLGVQQWLRTLKPGTVSLCHGDVANLLMLRIPNEGHPKASATAC